MTINTPTVWCHLCWFYQTGIIVERYFADVGSSEMIYAYRKSDFYHINIESISYGDKKFEKFIQIHVVMLSRDP